MYKTDYGMYDGDKWEHVSKICLKTKFSKEGYQDMPANCGGDLGIEGFIGSMSRVYQCYCPDYNVDNIKLYELQRDKITTDIGKLAVNHALLPSYTGIEQIKEWIFITPEYTNKELNKHARNKEQEIIAKGLTGVSSDFSIIIWTIEDLLPEINTVFAKVQEITIPVTHPTNDNDIADWSKEENSLVEAANRKNKFRLAPHKQENLQAINKLTENNVREFLDGDGIINNWKKFAPEEYEKFLRIVSNLESRVQEDSITSTEVPQIRMERIKRDVLDDLKIHFPNLSYETIGNIASYIVSGWILKCPLNFE